ALEHVALRVRNLERALAELPDGLEVERRREGEVYFELGEGVALSLVEADTDLDYDLDHVALRSADPQATASEYGSLGFRAAAPGRSNCPRVEIDSVVDAANTLAVFVWGPERVRIEYVEHKPTFSLT